MSHCNEQKPAYLGILLFKENVAKDASRGRLKTAALSFGGALSLLHRGIHSDTHFLLPSAVVICIAISPYLWFRFPRYRLSLVNSDPRIVIGRFPKDTIRDV